jgi:cytochrome P450
MHDRREDPSKPAWGSDQLDSPVPPGVEAPYFDEALEAWVLTRHEDVLAAFRSASLSPGGTDKVDEGALLQMREETREALSPEQLRTWRERLMPCAEGLVRTLPEGRKVDLLEAYARPACLALAVMVTGADPGDAERLWTLAQPVSAASAEPYDPDLQAEAAAANAQLRGCFHKGPETLRDSGFVALSHTMPCLLANAWYALLQAPDQWELLHRESDLVETAVEELLRYAGLTRIMKRRAVEDVVLGGASLRKGERVILRIIAANRDPKRFVAPNRVNATRRDGGQLTLGAGPHACVAANLIRMAANAITRPLLERFAAGILTETVKWQGGTGFRSPVALQVVLQKDA